MWILCLALAGTPSSDGLSFERHAARISAWAACEAQKITPSARPVRLDLSEEQARLIGRLIWKNEGAGRVDLLTHWNEGEAFASMGIGHFIWYPDGKKGPFTEDFPALLAFLSAQGVAPPSWLPENPQCPWPDRDAFQKDFDSPRLVELREFLARTFDLQTRFIIARFERALPRMLDAVPEERKGELLRHYDRVAASSVGIYALIDYVNFKGEGVSPAERYEGVGWGLAQVLQEMKGTEDGPAALRDFADAAEKVLSRRVAHSPPERGEARWLPGWKKRIQTYRAADLNELIAK